VRGEKEAKYLINHLSKKEINEDFAQSYFVAIIMQQFATHQEWQSETSKEVMLYLSLFHDISLFDQGLAKINTKTKLEALELHDRIKVENHAFESADLVSKFNNIPFGLTQIIREHHGEKEGVGIPETLSINVSHFNNFYCR